MPVPKLTDVLVMQLGGLSTDRLVKVFVVEQRMLKLLTGKPVTVQRVSKTGLVVANVGGFGGVAEDAVTESP